MRLLFPASVAILASVCLAEGQPGDRFEWFRPWVAIDVDEVRDMDRGRIISKTLPTSDSEIALLFAGAINTDPDRFIDAMRHPEELWTSARVPRVERFSMPPQLEDVEDMRLDERDVEAIRRCVPGDCNVKLAATEISRLGSAASIQDEFRRLVVERVRLYLEKGLSAAATYYDHSIPIEPAKISSGLLMRLPWLTDRAPRLAKYVETFPSTRGPAFDSFIYWLETTHTPRPTVQVVHVAIARRHAPGAIAPEVLIVSRQVFASHYINGSLAVSVLLHDRSESRRYLVYVTRAHVDGLDGWLDGFRRFFIEHTVRRRGASALDEQRRRIEAWRAPRGTYTR